MLDITTICTLDRIKDLYRFIELTQANTPETRIHVALVHMPNETPSDWFSTEVKLADRPGVITRSVKFNELENWGRLIYFDILKSKLTNIFDLNRMLYIDVDVDVVSDLSDIWSDIGMGSRAGATVDPWQSEEEPEYLSRLCAGKSYAEPLIYQTGFMCIKDPDRTLSKEVGDIFAEFRGYEYLERSIMPGTLLWNMWLIGYPDGERQITTLSDSWHTTFFGGDRIFNARALHFNGPFKHIRHHCTYQRDYWKGNTITISPAVGEYIW